MTNHSTHKDCNGEQYYKGDCPICDEGGIKTMAADGVQDSFRIVLVRENNRDIVQLVNDNGIIIAKTEPRFLRGDAKFHLLYQQALAIIPLNEYKSELDKQPQV